MEPITRTEDAELLGYIRPTDGSDNLWAPCTVFDYQLTDASDKHKAEQYLQANGLAVLAEPWWFHDRERDDWFKCDIVEAHKDKVRVRIADYGHPEIHQYLVIDAPSRTTLRHEYPKNDA